MKSLVACVLINISICVVCGYVCYLTTSGYPLFGLLCLCSSNEES